MTNTNLYWKTKNGTITLEPKQFKSETDFEQYIFENQEVLGGDINIIHRQIRTGSKQGIADMIGVDQDSRLCIIEVKNIEADENILPQALGYAVWAESNPDSLKAIWLESKSKPDSIQIDWDRFELRIILVAPSFRNNVPNMASKLGYKVELYQIRRYSYENNDLLLVDVLNNQPSNKSGITKVLGDWSWETYKADHDKDATTQFKNMVEAFDSFSNKHGWDLPYNLNKYYTGFKLGTRVVFSVHWASNSTWNVKLKITEKIAKQFQGKDWEYQRYDSSFHEALFKPLNPDAQAIGELGKYLIKAYENVSGRK